MCGEPGGDAELPGHGVLARYDTMAADEIAGLPLAEAKTIHINQLLAMVSILVGAELFGVAGALLGLPAAGVIQVIVRVSGTIGPVASSRSRPWGVATARGRGRRPPS